MGSGKSSVARILESYHALVIDSDLLAHEVLRDREVSETLRNWWGERVINSEGGVDRHSVADIVFSDAEQLRRLESLLYPRIEQRRAERMAAREHDPQVFAVVIDAPKLYEAGVDKVCDAVIFVDADPATRLQRVQSSRRWSEEEWRRREQRQEPLDPKKARADYIVVNNSSIEQLRHAVKEVFDAILASFTAKRKE